MITHEAIEKLLQTGRAQNEVNKNLEGDPFFITPAGEVVELAEHFAPRRIEETVTLMDAESFINYYNTWKTPASVIFASLTESNATFTGILDYHSVTDLKPDYCRHKVTFTTLPTPEWATWLKSNRQPMNQVQFATWIEDNMKMLVVPKDEEGNDLPGYYDAQKLMALVEDLHGHQNARFNNSVRLRTGANSVTYVEDIEIRGGATTEEWEKRI